MKLPLQTLRLGQQSLLLDWQFLRGHYPLSFFDKCQFLIIKYISIVKYSFFRIPFNPKENYTIIGGQKIFYCSALGMSIFQSMIVTLDRQIIPLLDSVDRPVIIDVGAHVGFFSILQAFFLRNPLVYALEPVSTTFRLLNKNTKNMSSIKIFRIGLFDKTNKMTIYFNPQFLMCSSLFRSRFLWDKNVYHETIPVTTLDSFCAKNDIRTINLLKIDAEGAEEKILKGGQRMLSYTHYLFVECSLDQVNQSTFTSVISCLVGKNYNFQLVKITSTMENEGRLLLLNMLFRNILYK